MLWRIFREKDKESKSIESLESYICELFEIEHISAKIKKQIKDMITYYNFTYSGILGTLKYWYEIKNNTTEKANQGIGIVPYVYTDAKKYYETIFYAQQSNKDINLDSIAKERLKIIIKSPKVNRNKFKVIDIDSLEGKVKND